MNPECAKDLTDLIMLEDFVARRRALDAWCRKWVASVKVDHPVPERQARVYEYEADKPGAWDRAAKAALLDKVLVGMLNADDQVSAQAIGFEVSHDGELRVGTLRLCILLEKPL